METKAFIMFLSVALILAMLNASALVTFAYDLPPSSINNIVVKGVEIWNQAITALLP